MKLIKKQSIWISDLTHTAQGSSSWTFPLGASYVFSYAKQELGDDTIAGFVLPPNEHAGLGEVVISYPRAIIQAKHAGHSTKWELSFLLTHGILHLLGYDHFYPEQVLE